MALELLDFGDTIASDVSTATTEDEITTIEPYEAPSLDTADSIGCQHPSS
jgi:hypothetical protein